MNFEKACSILELKNTFTKIELKKTYYRLALKYHPDKNPDDFESNEKFRELHEAYKFLGDSINIENEDVLIEKTASIYAHAEYIQSYAIGKSPAVALDRFLDQVPEGFEATLLPKYDVTGLTILCKR